MPGATVSDAFGPVSVTTAVMSVLGVAAANPDSTTEYDPLPRGVGAPQSEVNSATPSSPGSVLNALMPRLSQRPRQLPTRPTRRTSSVPSSSTPALERVGLGGVTRMPSRSVIPLGRPSASEKRSPLTPTEVACVERRRCIADTVSRSITDSFESAGRRR